MKWERKRTVEWREGDGGGSATSDCETEKSSFLHTAPRPNGQDDVVTASITWSAPWAGTGLGLRWGFGLVPFVVAEMSVDGLHVGEDTLPVWRLHLHHVVHVQQRSDVSHLPANTSIGLVTLL